MKTRLLYLLLAVLLPFLASCGGDPEGSPAEALAAAAGSAMDSPADPHAAHGVMASPAATEMAGSTMDSPADPHAAHAAMDSPARTTAAAPGSAPLTGHSVYHLPGTWRDQTDRELKLADLAGRPRVVAFVYTSCAFACPRIVARMKQIEARAAASGVGLVLVSIDPERDTPERLGRYAEATHLDPARWTLLNGPDDQILELSVLLDVPWFAAGNGEFGHANVLTLLDAQGAVVERIEGLESDLAPILDALGA